MALSASTVFEIQATATASNVNGGGFNPANANMLTDLAVTLANTAAPVATSASYPFVSNDIGNWLFIKSGTNFTPGSYKIISVSGGAATLSAAVGSSNVSQVNLNRYGVNTVIGCATVASPTGGTFTIDYSQSTACITSTSVSDYASVGSSTTMTSLTAAFTPVMVGNLFHLNNAGTGGFGVVGWYEIATYVNATTVTTDRTTNSGTAMVAGQGKIGGALSLGSSDDAVFELAVSSATASARFFIKGNATYTIGGSVSIAAAGNFSWPIVVEGYNSFRGDRPTGSTRPILSLAANVWTFGIAWDTYSIVNTGSSSISMTLGQSNKYLYSKGINTSNISTRIAIALGVNGFTSYSEFISYRGRALTSGSVSTMVYGCYIHSSDTGFVTSSTAFNIFFSIFEACITSAISGSSAITGSALIANNTLYGSEAKLGIGLSVITGSSNLRFLNNIIYGFATGVSQVDVNTSDYDDFNNYYNNTNDVSAAANWQKGPNDIAVDPMFTSVSQVTGTAGKFSAANNILIDTTKNFTALGVVAGQDFVYIISGTGITNSGMWVGITSISTTTNPNDTLNLDIAQGTNTTADKVYTIPVGHNFLPTGAV